MTTSGEQGFGEVGEAGEVAEEGEEREAGEEREESDVGQEQGSQDPGDRESTGAESPDAQERPDSGVAPARPAGPAQRALAWCRQRRPAVIAGALVLVSAVVAGSVYWWLYRPDVLTGPQARDQVTAAAKEGIEAALSYSPENLDQDLDKARSHLTGEFLDYYRDFTDKVVTPAAKQKGVKTEANVARAAVSQMRPEKAEVLVFVNQVTTSKDRPTPALATSTVLVTMVKSGDRWLISEFKPV